MNKLITYSYTKLYKYITLYKKISNNYVTHLTLCLT